MRKSRSAFTIVELLIVIVVIAILAAITIVAYNGIQTRAKTSSTVNKVTAYTKLINLYIAGESAYPLTSSTCLQVITGTCSSRNSTLDTNLQKYGALPADDAYTDITYYYGSRTLDGVGPQPVLFLVYSIDGTNQDCGLSNIVNQTGTDIFVTDTSSPRNTIANSAVPRSGMTRCYMYIPGP